MVLQECQLEWTRNKLKRDCKVELTVMLTISRSIIRTTMFLKLTILTKDGLLPVTILWLYENIFNLSSMSWLLSILICSKWMTCTQAYIWLKYCWYEIKHENNQSIIQKKVSISFFLQNSVWETWIYWTLTEWLPWMRKRSMSNLQVRQSNELLQHVDVFKKYTDFNVFVMWVKKVKFLP